MGVCVCVCVWGGRAGGGRNNSSFLFALLFLYSVPSHPTFLNLLPYHFLLSLLLFLPWPTRYPTPFTDPLITSLSPFLPGITSHITHPLYHLPRYTLLLCTYPIPPLFLSLFLFISLARKLAPTVIFIDEIDTLLRKRESGEMSSSAGTTMQVTAVFNRRFPPFSRSHVHCRTVQYSVVLCGQWEML